MAGSDAFEKARTEIDLLEFCREHVDSDIRRRGSNYAMRCPRTDADSDPSFIIFPNRNRFQCYHCGDWKGSIIDLVMGLRDTDEIGALTYLDELYPELELKVATTGKAAALKKFLEYQTKTVEDAHGEFMRSQLLSQVCEARGFSAETVRHFKLGVVRWGGFPRMSIPQFDRNGRALAVVTRGLDPADPRGKYLARNVYVGMDGKMLKSDQRPGPEDLTVWEKSGFLYGLEAATPKAPVYLVEGHLDRVAAHELGMANFCAVGTWQLASGQVELLEAFPSIVLVPDSDDCGRKSVLENLTRIRSFYPDKPVFVAQVPQPGGEKVKDLGDVLKSVAKDRTMSSQEVQQHFAGAVYPAEITLLNRIAALASYPATFIPGVKAILAQATEPMTRAMFIKQAAKLLGVDPSVLSGLL